MAISMLKIRRPLGRLIFNMGIAIPGKTVFLIETAPRLLRYACLLLLISMLRHRQAILESTGDKLLFSAAECKIRTQGLRHQIASRLNAHLQTDWAIEDQA